MKKIVRWGILGIATVSLGMWFLTTERCSLLQVGDVAPDCIGNDQDGRKVDIRQFRGTKDVVLFFYPKDFTQGCTTEACTFRDQFDSLTGSGAVIVGISSDDTLSHHRFSSAYNLPYHLLSDRNGIIGKRYGVLWLGGILPWFKRVTYVIDKKGMIRGVFRHEFNVSQHVEDVLACLRTTG